MNEQIWQIVLGFSFTFLLGRAVPRLLDTIRAEIELPPPHPRLKKKWEHVTGNHVNKKKTDKRGDLILGELERLLFFASAWLGAEAYAIIVAWLAFKVGSKWQVWSNIISVPKEIERVDPLDYLHARVRWGSLRLMTFLVGTLYNVVAAFAGTILGKYGYKEIQSLFF